jgi:iron complex outermembrane receptor protein
MKKPALSAFIKSSLGLAVAAALSPATSLAAVQLEEIVVTAQKRSESLQDVPISVMAVSGEELASLNRNEVAELSKSIAGFTFQTGSGDSEKAIQIRGVGTSTFSKGVEQSVGTVIDGVVSSSLVASFLDFSDVERVEVLRGPQGMLFGKNASSGMLNITTQKPTDELSFGASASFAEENERKYTAYVSGGLTDTVKARLSYYSNERDGFIDNIAGVSGDYNNRDEWGAAAKVLLEPTDNLSVQLNYTHSERDYSCCYRPPVTVVGNFAAVLPQGKENDKIYEIGTESPNTADVDVWSIEANYDIGEHTLTSITSYTDTETGSNVLATGLPVDLLNDNTSIDETKQYTQELRITSPADQTISYVAGLYYYKNELDREQIQVFNPPYSLSLYTKGFASAAEVDNTSYAIFGQATWNINEAARLSLGLRYNDDEVMLDQTVVSLLDGDIVGGGNRKTTVDETNLQWRIIGEYNLADDKMVYATVARGYKGPGANTLETGLTAPKPIVDPEIPTNYELGLKSEWLDGRLRLNASAFLTKFEDFQASLSDNDIPPSFFLSNAGELETKGIELELTAQATENLFLSANLAHIDATFKDFDGAACYPTQTPATGCVGGQQDLSGADLPFSPDLTINLFARYEIPLNDLPFNSYVQGSYHWQDEVQFNTSNDPLTVEDSYGIADFALGFVSNDGIYEAQFFVKNAFDKFYRSGMTTQGTPFGVLLAHSLEYDYTRRVGFKVQMNF